MPSSSFILKAGAVLFALSSTTFAQIYKVQDVYEGKSFLDGFNFITTPDPTNGFVNYLSRDQGTNSGLLRLLGDDNYIGVDYNTPLNFRTSNGRNSIRIEGNKNYNKGLFIVDLKHMPGGICGTWPAFWSLGDGEWPKHGEIDIIEGVNLNKGNKYVLHTDTNCKVDGSGLTGTPGSKDCALDGPNGPGGCDVDTNGAVPDYGTAFNSNGGGVYAMEWTSQHIKMWFFPRNNIPASILADKPNLAEFGTPTANFQGGCDIDTRFQNHRFIFDTTFCGDWAGNVYQQSSCPQYSGLSGMESCKRFVAENPSAFRNAYWVIKSFKTYTRDTIISSSSSIASSTQSSTMSSSTHSSTMSSSTFSSAMSSSTQSSIMSSSTQSSVMSSSTQSSTMSSSTFSSVMSSSTQSSIMSSSTQSSIMSSSTYSSTMSSSAQMSSSSSSTQSSSMTSSYASSSVISSSSSPAASTGPYNSGTYSGSSSILSYGSSSSYPTGYGGSSNTPAYSSGSAYPTAYGGSSSAPAYGSGSSYPTGYGSGSATSTPCTSSAHKSSSTPAAYAYDYSSSKPADYDTGSKTSTPCTTSTPAAYGYPSSSSPAAYAYSSSAADYDSEYTPEYSSAVEDYASEYAPEYTTTENGYPSETPASYGATSTPCSTSTAVHYGASSVPSYETNQSTPVGYQPYTTSKPAESKYVETPKVYSHIITATYTHTYVDICSTGYTTKTTTQTVEYNPKTTTQGYTTAPPPGLTVTTKVCTACAATPVTVTLTVPCETTSTYVKPTPPVVYSKAPPPAETPISYTYCKTCTNLTPTVSSNGHQHVHKTFPVAPTPYVDDSTSTVYQSKISTVYIAPSPAPPSYKSSLVPPPCVGQGCQATVPTPQKPYPTAATNVYSNGKVTLSYGTGTGSAYVPSKTYSSQVSYFTGGAEAMRVGGAVVGGVVAAVAMVL